MMIQNAHINCTYDGQKIFVVTSFSGSPNQSLNTCQRRVFILRDTINTAETRRYLSVAIFSLAVHITSGGHSVLQQ